MKKRRKIALVATVIALLYGISAAVIMLFVRSKDHDSVTDYTRSIDISKARFLLLQNDSEEKEADPVCAGLDYDDSSWQEVSIPHDWSIACDFNPLSKATFEGGFLDGGEAWYRMEIPISLDMQSKNIYLDFDGVYMNSEIFVNGKKLSENNMGYNPFRIEITDYISFTGKNLLAVYVSNNQISSRYYSGSGIYRPVKLVVEDNSEIAVEDIVVTTPNLDSQYETVVDTVVTCSITGHPDSVTVDIIQDDGSVVGSTTGKEGPFTVQVLRPKLWDVYEGNLYTARITAQKGNSRYVRTVWFGYRFISFDKEGFYLNGKKTFLKGVCLHHDLGCIGAEANTSAMARQLDMMVEMGVNAVRTTHNPEGENFLRLCAEKGILVIEEFFDTWRYPKKENDYSNYFLEDWQHVIETTVKRDINNPGIIMWSLGNEISTSYYYSKDGSYDNMIADCKALHQYTKTLDPTRYTTTAIADLSETGYLLADNVDIIGLNYASESTYQAFRDQFPDKPLYGSETTSAVSSRGEYSYQDGKTVKMAMDEYSGTYQCSSYDNNIVSWTRNADSAAGVVKNHMNSDKGVFGMFVWTGFDYIGEPTPYYEWPTKNSFFGIVDLAGFPKDIYWMYQSAWTSEPMIHILPMTWDFTTGSTQYVWLYSNCETVELFLNGTSLGRMTRNQIGSKMQFEYEVVYEPGVLIANGYDADGRLTAQDMIFTSTGEAKGLELKAWYSCVDYNSSDLAFIECNVVDDYGVRVPDAADNITFTVDGGTVLGTDNGNSPDTTNMHSPSRDAFHGKVLCVIRHDGKPGTMTVTASGEGLGQKQIRIEKGLYTGRSKTMPTSFVDAGDPPAHPFTDIIAAPTDSSTAYHQIDLNFLDLTGSNPITRIESGKLYLNVLTPAPGYEILSCSITVGGADASDCFNPDNNSITIPDVDGNVMITAIAGKVNPDTFYSIVKTGSNVIYSNGDLKISGDQPYSTTITAESGYKLESVIVTMGGTDITETAYSNGLLSIDAVSGDLVIMAQTAAYYYSVMQDLSHITSSNINTSVRAFDAFSTVLTAENKYALNSVTVTMNGTDITSSVYHEGLISIENVTGDVVITANGNKNDLIKINYAPQGKRFSNSVSIDLKNGEYIEAEIDLTNCTKENENILSIGTSIDEWVIAHKGLENQGVYHLYYTADRSELQCDISYAADPKHGNSVKGEPVKNVNGIILVKLSSTGLYINGEQVRFDPKEEEAVLANLMSSEILSIGSMEGKTRSNAAYSCIRVVGP